jgi:hypothetical protein
MNRIITLGLMGAGAWLLYNSLASPPRDAATAPAGNTADPSVPAAPAAPEDLRAAVLRGYRLDGNTGDLPAALTFDQWNYYASRADRGPLVAIEDALPGANRAALLDFSAWSVASQLAGLGVWA